MTAQRGERKAGRTIGIQSCRRRGPSQLRLIERREEAVVDAQRS